MLVASLAVPENVNKDQRTADSHGDNLERNTSHDEVVAAVDELLVGCTARSCHTSTASLEHDGAKIATDEDPRIEPGLEQRVLGSTVQDKVFEREINRRSNETRTKNQTADL